MVDQTFEPRPLALGQEAEACELVRRVFTRFVAPQFPPEGVEEFLSYVNPQALVQRRAEGNLQLAAWTGEEMVAYLEMREGPHLALLFIDPARQRQGVGKRLLARALEIWGQREPEFERVTVNSSPNATAAYQSMGFEADGEMQSKNGITFMPMHLAIDQGKGHN